MIPAAHIDYLIAEVERLEGLREAIRADYCTASSANQPVSLLRFLQSEVELTNQAVQVVKAALAAMREAERFIRAVEEHV